MVEPEFSFLVLCAGLGTRLRPLTDELPKPLMPLGDRPLLAHIVQFILAQGLRRGLINTHHLAARFEEWLADAGLPLTVLHEPVIRGTAGGLAGARSRFGAGPILLWNGDIWSKPPVLALLEAAGDGLALAVAPRPAGQGTVGLDPRGRVVRLRGEIFGTESCGGDYVGVAGVGAACRAKLPEQGCLIGDFALPALRYGDPIQSVLCDSAWTDIGNLDAYLDANLAWLESAGRTEWVGPGARLAPSIELRRAVIGAGAVIEGSGTLDQVVVWPGVRLNLSGAPAGPERRILRRTVVTRAGQHSALAGAGSRSVTPA